MSVREFSNKSNASGVFFDLLGAISRRGWFNAGPLQEDGENDYLLYVHFHIHPDDAERINLLFEEYINNHEFWYLKREQGNRFSLYSRELKNKVSETDDFRKAVHEINSDCKDLGKKTAKELIALSDILYQRFKQ
jgi:hypothetical protein